MRDPVAPQLSQFAYAMPTATTNVEFGLDVSTGRAVLGFPPDCPNPERNRYLIYVARRYGVPVCTALTDTVAAALALSRAAADPTAPQPATRGGIPDGTRVPQQPQR
ncbi:hypothetical protein ACWD0E_28075 [Streptomyces sp. NPDC003002]